MDFSGEGYVTGGDDPQITMPDPATLVKQHQRAGWAVAAPSSALASARRAPPTPDELAQVDAVLARVQSGESVRKACLAVGLERTQFTRFLAVTKDGDERLRAAREAQADAIVDSMADDETAVRDELRDEANAPIANQLVGLARLRFDRKKFQAGAFAPAVYGGGKAGGGNVAVQVNTAGPVGVGLLVEDAGVKERLRQVFEG